jgi:hypothetical protein
VVAVDFDSKYKILWGETTQTRDHEVPIHERKKISKKEYHTGPSWGGLSK